MKAELVFKNITKLQTPVGFFSVSCEDTLIPFSVERNSFDLPSEVYDGNKVIGTIHTDTNYCIVIDSRKLEIGKEYIVKFFANEDCKWDRCDSDEHTTCFDTIIGEWAVGIGAYDPNDLKKEEQAWDYSERMGFLKQKFVQEPPTYDETTFIEYTVANLKTYDGYRFKVFGYSSDRIYFEVAWIKIDEYPEIEYEGALGYWLC